MSPEPFQKPPYLDWNLDRWKTGIILLIFGGLVISWLAGPAAEPATADAQGRATARATPTVIVLAGSNDPQPTVTATPSATPTAPAEGRGETVPAPSTLPTADGAAQIVTDTMPAANPTAAPAPHLFPLTLANVSPNAIVPAQSIRVLYGTAAAGSLVEVRDQVTGPVADTDQSSGVSQEVVLGTTAADNSGLWQLGPFTPLAPGQHVLTVYQLDVGGAIEEAASPVVVTVLGPGEQGPLSLATPAIKFPTLGARLRRGQATFVGAGLPGMTVRLYLDNRQVSEGIVTAREEWRLTTDGPLTPGVHVVRVATVNSDGGIIAESAPVVFWVEDELSQSRLPLPTPALPLRISSLAFGDRLGQSVVVRGQATPHSGVSAWVGGEPVGFANALTDGGWQFWLFEEEVWTDAEEVEIRSSLGERLVTEARPLAAAEAAPSYAPMILSPLDGDVLTTRRPLVVGMAQPSSEIALVVNRRVVARVVADRRGMWTYQLTDPLPAGYSSFMAEVEATWTTSGLTSHVVVVTLAPQL